MKVIYAFSLGFLLALSAMAPANAAKKKDGASNNAQTDCVPRGSTSRRSAHIGGGKPICGR
jgi:hypothetical protein